MGGTEEKINEWFSVVREKSGGMTRAVKVIDEWLMEKIGKEIGKGVVRWKTRVLVWYKWRVKFMRWRLEKWVPGIMKECEIDVNGKQDCYEEQDVVYVIFNLRNRKRYIGETKQWLRNRIIAHMNECKRGRVSKKAKEMNDMGLKLWIVIPIRRVKILMDRRMEELKMIHKWKPHVINDRFTYASRLVVWDLVHGEDERRWRMDIMKTVKNDLNFAKCSKGEAWALIEKERRYRLSGKNKRIFDGKVVKLLSTLDKRIRMSYSIDFPWGDYSEKRILRLVKLDLRYRLGSNLGRYVEERLKAVRVQGKTIWDMVNTKKTRHLQVGNGEPRCECGSYPEEWLQDGHVCVRVRDIEDDEIRSTLDVNNKTMVRMSKAQVRKKILTSVRQLYKQFEEEVPENVRKEIDNLEPEGNSGVDYWRVDKILDRLKGIVVYELDKNNKALCLMCEKLYEEKMVESFSGQQYRKIDVDVRTAENGTVQIYKRTKIGKRFGVRKVWSLDRAKVIPKNKDLSRMRPIISSAKSMEGKGAERCSRAMTVMVQWIGKRWTNMDIQDKRGVIDKMKKTNMDARWMKVRSGQTGVTYIELDMKNQYTNLRHEELRHAFRSAIDLMKEEGNDRIWIARDKQNKRLDNMDKKGQSTQVFEVLTVDEVAEYVYYKLDYCFFQMGEQIMQQTEGVPMGGKVSAQLAELFCMWKENENVRLWKGGCGLSVWMRYRDDIRVVLHGRIGKEVVSDIVDKVDRMYGEQIEVLMEAMSYERMNFLDVRVRVKNGTFEWFDNNKNYDIGTKDKRKMALTRFPNPQGGAPRKVLINTMSGVMRSTAEKCSTMALVDACVWQNVMEFATLGYNGKDIVKAMYKANHEMADRMRNEVRGWLERRTRSLEVEATADDCRDDLMMMM